MFPRRSWNFFSKYTISAVLNFYVFYSVEYSAISMCLRLRPQTPTGALPLDPAGGLPSPRPLFCLPRSKFLATPLITMACHDGRAVALFSLLLLLLLLFIIY